MWRRKKKHYEDLEDHSEFDAPSVLDLVNISGKPKPQTYGQYLWGLMFGSEKEAFIHELAEMDPESAEAILENQEYPNQAKEMYIERMSDDNSHDEGGYTEEPDEDDDRAEYDEYNIYGDKEADGHGTTVNPEVAIAYTNDWLSATKGRGDSDDDGDEESEPDADETEDDVWGDDEPSNEPDAQEEDYDFRQNTQDSDEDESGAREMEMDESSGYRDTEYSPDDDFDQHIEAIAFGAGDADAEGEVDAEGDVDADADADGDADGDADSGIDQSYDLYGADYDIGYGTDYGDYGDFGDWGDWGDWGDYQ